MPDRTHHPPNLIYAAGSQVVTVRPDSSLPEAFSASAALDDLLVRVRIEKVE